MQLSEPANPYEEDSRSLQESYHTQGMRGGRSVEGYFNAYSWWLFGYLTIIYERNDYDYDKHSEAQKLG